MTRLRMMLQSLREDTSYLLGLDKSAQRYDISGGSHRIFALIGESIDLVERLEEDVGKLTVDLVKRPGERLQILYPLEVGDDNAACVCENVGDDYLALGVENLIRLIACRAVCALSMYFAFIMSALSSVI